MTVTHVRMMGHASMESAVTVVNVFQVSWAVLSTSTAYQLICITHTYLIYFFVVIRCSLVELLYTVGWIF